MSDGTGALDQYFGQMQHELGLDFAASSDHDHRWETPDEFWGVTRERVRQWNQPGVFPVLLGYEWAKWRKDGAGDRNVYYRSDDRPMYRSDTGDYATPPELFAALRKNGERAIVIPHHPAHGGNFCDWKDHDPEFERLVEIFQVRGSYECAPAEGNLLSEKANAQAPFATGYVRDALAAGWRVGFTGGGDDHRGDWGTEAIPENDYPQGLMCVFAPERTREAIFDAMWARRVTATSGPRIFLRWTLNGAAMGSELKGAGSAPRRLTIEFHGTAPAERIEIIRNNRVVHSVPGGGREDMKVEWIDIESGAALWLPPATHCPHPFAFYYVRVIQTDREVAWASPIWMDPA